MLKNVINQILENHTKIKPSGEIIREKYYIDNSDIEISIEQNGDQVTLWAFKNSTDRVVNLFAERYKVLINGFKEVSQDFYSKSNKVYIALKKVDITMPRKTNIYGYTRVSTKGQLDNNSLEQQENEILNKYNNADIIKESYTGTTTDRPELNKLIIKLTRGDLLVVTKLDRLARNTVEGIEIIEGLFDKGVSVHVLNVGLLENTTMGRFFITTLLAVAEMERNTIIERTQSGKAIAKQRPGFKEGRPQKYNQNQLDNALSMLSINGGDKSYNEVSDLLGISKSTLIREVRKRKANV